MNAFDPNGRRGVSDFDTTHQINANWIAELPFGNGRRFAGKQVALADAFIGGWQLSAWPAGPAASPSPWITATSGLRTGTSRVSLRWSPGRRSGIKRSRHGCGQRFRQSAAAFADFVHPFPGQSGSRNVVRGDGYAGLDMALSKRWKMPREGQSLQFRWEVFNVPNLHRFNVLSGLGTRLALASLRCNSCRKLIRQLHRPADAAPGHAVRAEVRILRGNRLAHSGPFSALMAVRARLSAKASTEPALFRIWAVITSVRSQPTDSDFLRL